MKGLSRTLFHTFSPENPGMKGLSRAVFHTFSPENPGVNVVVTTETETWE